ncbi:MAG TPA: hypothetical protein VJG83_03570 [archaeon]|nr:hypothetical protein [archaeon]
MLDTNVYGSLVEIPERTWLIEGLRRNNSIVCGSVVIRQELRNIPKKKLVGNEKTRNLCLNLYDALVEEKRNYIVSNLIEVAAKTYYENYLGNDSWKEIEKDFLIVATSSIHKVNIVISNDENTMASKEAINAYTAGNMKFQIETPKFIKLEEFRQLLK